MPPLRFSGPRLALAVREGQMLNRIRRLVEPGRPDRQLGLAGLILLAAGSLKIFEEDGGRQPEDTTTETSTALVSDGEDPREQAMEEDLATPGASPTPAGTAESLKSGKPDIGELAALAMPELPPPSTPRRNLPSANEVLTGGDIIERMAPDYPASARRRGINGSVEVKFLVTRHGSVRDIEIIGEAPRGLAFADSARDAITRWRFEPFRTGDETDRASRAPGGQL